LGLTDRSLVRSWGRWGSILDPEGSIQLGPGDGESRACDREFHGPIELAEEVRLLPFRERDRDEVGPGRQRSAKWRSRSFPRFTGAKLRGSRRRPLRSLVHIGPAGRSRASLRPTEHLFLRLRQHEPRALETTDACCSACRQRHLAFRCNPVRPRRPLLYSQIPVLNRSHYDAHRHLCMSGATRCNYQRFPRNTTSDREVEFEGYCVAYDPVCETSGAPPDLCFQRKNARISTLG
jgi:hypothetical protein